MWDPIMPALTECTITLYYELAWRGLCEPKHVANFVVMIIYICVCVCVVLCCVVTD